MEVAAVEIQRKKFYVLKPEMCLNLALQLQDGADLIRAIYQTPVEVILREQKVIIGNLFDLIKA